MSAMYSKHLQTVTVILLITAFCLFIMAFLVYSITAATLKQEITNAYRVSLLHTRDRMENYLKQMDRASLQLEKSPEVERMISRDSGESTEQLDALSLMTILKRIHAATDYVDNILIYDARTHALFATNPFMNRAHENYLPAVSRFLSLGEKRAFFNMEINGIPTNLYVRKLPALHAVQPLCMIYHVNERIYDDLLGEERYAKNGNYFIIDRGGRILAARGPSGIGGAAAIVDRINRDKIGLRETDIGSFSLKGAFVAYLPPSFDGWVYGFSIPNRVFLKELNHLRNTILLIAFSLLAVSCGVSVVSSNFLWRGWNRIKGALAGDQGGERQEKANEFDLVFSHIKNVVDRSALLQHRMNEVMPALRNSVIASLLDSGVRTQEDWDNIRQFDIRLVPGTFICICLELDRTWEPDRYSDRDISTFDFAVASVVRESLAKRGLGNVICADKGTLSAVVGTESSDGAEFQRSAVDLADSIRAFIAEHFPVTVSIGVSRCRSNYNHLNISCREARELLRNKYLSGGDRVYSFREADDALAAGQIAIREIESDIVFGIKSRNRTYAYEALDQVRCVRDLPDLQYAWLQAKLVETAQFIFREIRKELDASDGRLEPTLDELLDLRTLDDWVKWFRVKCIDPLTERLSVKQRASAEKTAAAIRGYIRNHLECDIRMDECCTALGLPVSSAKAALKEATRKTFIDLVLDERIEQAKVWLRGGGMSVETIAHRLRYSNAQNFCRTFKRAVGVPPSHYRMGAEQVPSPERTSAR